MSDLASLMQKRAKLRRELRSIHNSFNDSSDRSWQSYKDSRDWNQKMDRVRELSEEIESRQVERERRRAELGDGDSGGNGPRAGRPVPGRSEGPSGKRWRNPKTDEEIRAYRPDERMADPDADGLSIGRYIVGLATGNWSGAEEERALATESDPSGGYLIPEPLSSRVIDLARAGSSVMAAGVQTVEMDSKTLSLTRVSSDPTPSWHRENATVATSEPGFEQVELDAKTLAVTVPISVEATEDSANLPDVVERTLRQALGLELDRAILRGSEPDTADANLEPVGIRWTDNVQLTSNSSSGLSNWDPISQDIQAVREQDGEPTALIWHPTLAGQAERLKATDDQPLQPPASVADITKIRSTQIPTDLTGSNDETELYVGDYRGVLVGMRTQTRIEATREGGDAFDKLQVRVRAYLRADAVLEHPEHHHVRHAITI